MKTINVFKNEHRENLYVTETGTGHKVTDVKAINGDIVMDTAGASGLIKIHGFGGRRRVVDVHAIASAIGDANNVLQFYNSSAVSNTLSMFSIAVDAADDKSSLRAIKRSNCIIAADAVLCVSGSGTAASLLRTTVVIKTIPA